MRLLTPPKLGLIVLVVIVLLGAATQAQADPGAAAIDIQPAPTASGAAPMATPTQNAEAIAATASQPTEGQQPLGPSPAALATGAGHGSPPSAPAVPATNASPVEQSSQNSVTANQTVPAISGNASSKSASPDPGPVSDNTAGTAGSTAPISSVTVPRPGGDQSITPSPAGNDETGLPSGSSNTTTQMIWQIQISGCRFHCVGTSQIQTAVQQNTTVQVIPAPLPVSPISTAPIGADGATAISAGPSASPSGSSQTTSNITQEQLGCLQHCFGTTTLSAPDQQLSQTAVDLLLGELGGVFPFAPMPTPAVDANVVDQTTIQSEDGRGPEGGQGVVDGQSIGDGQGIVDGQGGAGGQTAPVLQSESATQTAAAVQISPPSPSSELDAASPSEFPAGQTLNQTDQGIWQLQIGCVFDCFQTQQKQQAEQANNSIQVLLPVPGSAAPTASAASTATAVIWQLQIGCLFWCYDAAELQTAASNENSVVLVGRPPAQAPPPPTSGSGPATGQAPPAGSSSPSDPASSNGTTSVGTSPSLSAITPPSNRPIAASASQAPAATGIPAAPLPAVFSIQITRVTRGAVRVASLASASTTSISHVDLAPGLPQTGVVTFLPDIAAHRTRRRPAQSFSVSTPLPVAQTAVASSGASSLSGILLLLAAAVALSLGGLKACGSVRKARRSHG